MIVFADREEIVDTQSFLRAVRRARDPQERLILEGQLESGVMDALCPEVDDEFSMCSHPLPARITVRKPEGYAFYAVYPEMYREAALRFLAENHPTACVVVGIRSIGTSLSMVVAETVHASFRFTVRPRGHPFDRHLRLSERLESRIRSQMGSWFLIVDEGPGLSGSSFLSVAAKLEEIGVPRQRIALFPSHDPNPDAFVSDRSRASWRNYLSYVEPFRPERFVPSGATDIAGGSWRRQAYASEDDWPATHPQHERRKYFKNGRLWKFAGLGHFGRSKYERAQRLQPFCPAARGWSNGFIETGWIDAEPAILSDALLDAMAKYLAALRSEFATDRPVPAEALESMVEANTGIVHHAPHDGVVVELDGRMLPHEWLQAGDRYWKVDALDHHDDHFFPGCQDIAWDIAGAAVEWDFPVEALVSRYLRLQRDPTLHARLPFYETAYKAYRYGYCELAANTLGDLPDAERFRRLQERYRIRAA